MEEFVKGDVIVIAYPFSDFSTSKKRPALVIANPDGNDLIICQITSRAHFDKYSIPIVNNDFTTGFLDLESYIRPNKIISIDKSIISYKIGKINKRKIQEVINSVVKILNNQ